MTATSPTAISSSSERGDQREDAEVQGTRHQAQNNSKAQFASSPTLDNELLNAKILRSKIRETGHVRVESDEGVVIVGFEGDRRLYDGPEVGAADGEPRRAYQLTSGEVAELRARRNRAIWELRQDGASLGDLPRRAAEYAETRTGGTADDVRVMVRHFDRVLRAIQAKQVTKASITQNYAGRIDGWAARFLRLADDPAKLSLGYTERDLSLMRKIGLALDSLREPVVENAAKEADDALSAYVGTATEASDLRTLGIEAEGPSLNTGTD